MCVRVRRSDGEGLLGAPTSLFSTRLWAMRRAVQRGYDALHTVTELEHLLRTPLIWNNEEARHEVLLEVDESVQLLAQSLGIRSLQLNALDPIGGVELAIDGPLIAALLQTTKGKKLIIRSFSLLPPDKRWLLVQPILARILQTEHTGMSAEDRDAESKLIAIVKAFFQQAYLHGASLREQAAASSQPSSALRPVIMQLLNHFRQTVKSVVVTFMGKNQLRKVLLLDSEAGTEVLRPEDNPRLEVFRGLVSTGDKLAMLLSAIDGPGGDQGEEGVGEWRQIKETFLRMLEA